MNTTVSRKFWTNTAGSARTQAIEPASGSDLFLARLETLPSSAWAELELNAAATRDRLWVWDQAWEQAVAKGGYGPATRAMSAARRRGASRVVQALAGGAAAALAASTHLGTEQFNELYSPFAGVVPAGSLRTRPVLLEAAG
jgi:hypothetical protein